MFGESHDRKKQRLNRKSAKEEERKKAIEAAAKELVGLRADFNTPESILSDYARALSGTEEPGAQVMSIADVAQDGDPGVLYEDE